MVTFYVLCKGGQINFWAHEFYFIFKERRCYRKQKFTPTNKKEGTMAKMRKSLIPLISFEMWLPRCRSPSFSSWDFVQVDHCEDHPRYCTKKHLPSLLTYTTNSIRICCYYCYNCTLICDCDQAFKSLKEIHCHLRLSK